MLSEKDLNDLHYARQLLEHSSLAIKITAMIGTSIEKGFELLPDKWSSAVNQAARTALDRALHFAVKTMKTGPSALSSDRLHKWVVAATGGAGGAFGLPALSVELPISTIVMLRSIADIARSEGEDLKNADTLMACLEVFALGSRAENDDAAESGYFAVRAMLYRSMSEAARHIASQGMSAKGAPVVLRFIGQIASRFGVTVTEKAAAQALPVVGAIGGAVVNTLFLDHFQDMARGHFIIRRLERAHGADRIRALYEKGADA